MEIIEITRIAIRQKYGYFVPARYQTRQKWVVIDQHGEHDYYPTDNVRTFRQFVDKIKAKYGEEKVYKVDFSKPYVHTI